MTDTISTYKKDSTITVASEAKIIIAKVLEHIKKDNCHCCKKALEQNKA
jgi:hypothetical protein